MAALRWQRDESRAGRASEWRVAMWWAVPIVALVVYLFYTWFARLNRYQIFLYFHDMGPGFDTTPFGRVTASRYWMAGLVASGAVMAPYLALHFVAGRALQLFRPPAWRRVWLLCAAPLLVAIPAIVMTVNEPVLPLPNALQVTAATLVGLALAVALGPAAAERPLTFILLMFDGLALTCLLTSLIRLESLPRWLSQGRIPSISRHLIVTAAGFLLIALTTAVYAWWRRAEVPRAGELPLAGLAISYLFFPLYHHLFWSSDNYSWRDPDYFGYIPDADNYFALHVPLQLGVWIAVAATALAVTRLRRWLVRRRG